MADRPDDIRSYAERFYAELEPLQYDEPLTGWALLLYVASISEMFQEVKDLAGDIVIDGKTIPGWSVVVDLDRTPNKALGWLAQFVGVTIRSGLSDPDQRAWIRSTDGWKRGTRASMVGALTPYLTRTKTVLFRERYGSAYKLMVVTRWFETPDPVAAYQALLTQKPGGIVLDYHTINGRDYQEVKDDNASYAAAKANYGNYDIMRGADLLAGIETNPLIPQDGLVPAANLSPGG